MLLCSLSAELYKDGNDGKIHTPQEWFIVPLEVIKKAIFMIANGEIICYKYDEKEELIRQKEEN